MRTALLRFVRNLNSRDPVKLNKRILTFLVCVLLASLLWVLNSLSKRHVTNLVYPVTYTNIPEDKILVNKLPANVSLQLEGVGYQLFYQQVSKDRDTISIDVSELKALRGSSEGVLLTSSKLNDVTRQFPNEIKIIKIIPDTLYFKLTRKKSKMLPVKLNISLSFRKQHQLKDKVSIIPEAVIVTGPEHVVDLMEYIETDSIILNDLHSSTTQNVPLKIPSDFASVNTSTQYIMVTVPVEKYTEGSIKIPVKTNNIPEKQSVNLLPNEITVTYLVPFSKFDMVRKEMFRASADYNLMTGKASVPIELKRKPDFIKVIKISPDKVDFVIKKSR